MHTTTEASRVLIVEDLPSDAELCEREVKNVLGKCEFLRVETREEFIAALDSFRPTLIVSDFKLPHFDGLTALKLALERAPETPFIILTGSMNEDTAVECMKAGAWDYVIKEHIKRLGPAVLAALEQKHVRDSRKRAETALRLNRDLLDATQRLARIGGWEWDIERQTMTWTDETYRIHGMTPGEPAAGSPEHIDKSLACYDPADRPVIEAAFRRCAAEGQPYDLEFPLTRIDGRRIWIRTMAHAVKEGHRVVSVIGSIIDLTERKRAEEQEQRRSATLYALLNSPQDTVALLDTGGIIRHINLNGARRFGMTPLEMVGQNMYTLIPEPVASERKRIFTEVMETGQPAHFEDQRQGISFAISVYPFDDPQSGERFGVAIFAQDITARKQAEDALQESETRFRHLLQRVPNIAVQGYGPDGTTRYWNEASEHLYGYTAQEAIGRNLIDLIIPTEMRGEVEQAIQQMAETGQPIPASEVSLMRKDGSRVSVFSSHASVQIPGQAPEMFSIDIDISERKQSEEKMAEQLHELQRWHNVMLDREGRVIELKREVNELLARAGQPPQYPSAVAGDLNVMPGDSPPLKD